MTMPASSKTSLELNVVSKTQADLMVWLRQSSCAVQLFVEATTEAFTIGLPGVFPRRHACIRDDDVKSSRMLVQEFCYIIHFAVHNDPAIVFFSMFLDLGKIINWCHLAPTAIIKAGTKYFENVSCG